MYVKLTVISGIMHHLY